MAFRSIARALMLTSLLALSLPAPSPRAAAAAGLSRADKEVFTVADFGYGDRTAQTMYGALNYFIPLPQDWSVGEGAALELVLSHSPLLVPDRSTVTVFINDTVYASAFLDASNLDRGRLVVPFAVDALNPPEGLSLRLSFFMRLSKDVCEEINNPALWATVHKESAIRLPHTARAVEPDLSRLLDGLSPRGRVETPPIVFVLPEAADAATLTAAGAVAARLAHLKGGQTPEVRAVTAAALTEADRANGLVYVGAPGLDDVPAPPPGEAVVHVGASPWNPSRTILSLTGDMSKAALAFDDLATFSALTGTHMFVRGPMQVPDAVIPPPWTGPITTFAQLGDRNRRNTGFGTFDELFFIRRPAGWMLGGDARVVLHVDVSPAVRLQDSSIVVYANEALAGAVRIGAGVDQDTFSFTLPAALINQALDGSRTLELVLRVQIVQYAELAECVQSRAEAVSTQILTDSYLVTPHSYAALPDLREYPYPFVVDDAPAPTTIVVPDQPAQPVLSLALQMAAQLGRSAIQPLELFITPAGRLEDAARGAHHLIVISAGGRQPVGDELAARWPKVDALENPAGVYQSAASGQRAYIRAAASPWNSDRIALLIAAGSQPAVEAMLPLLENVPPVTAPGSVAVVAPGNYLQVVYRSTAAAPSTVPAEVQREPLLPRPQGWQVVLAGLLLTGLGIVGLIAVANWRARRKAG